jgi:hypothetical protein
MNTVPAVKRAPETKNGHDDSIGRKCQRTGSPDRERKTLGVSQ